jgi:hypothetical protein
LFFLNFEKKTSVEVAAVDPGVEEAVADPGVGRSAAEAGVEAQAGGSVPGERRVRGERGR